MAVKQVRAQNRYSYLKMSAKPVTAKAAAAAADAEEAEPLKGAEEAADLSPAGAGLLTKTASLVNGDRAQLNARSHSASAGAVMAVPPVLLL